jgi:hypothetical protein
VSDEAEEMELDSCEIVPMADEVEEAELMNRLPMHWMQSASWNIVHLEEVEKSTWISCFSEPT